MLNAVDIVTLSQCVDDVISLARSYTLHHEANLDAKKSECDLYRIESNHFAAHENANAFVRPYISIQV